jgi:hypothetical protein
MLEEIRKDLVASFLLRKSTLTEAQLDTVLASNVEGNLETRSSLREKGKVSKGAFLRTLKQGNENIASSVYTLFLLAYLDLIPPDSIAQLSRTARMLSQLKSAEADRVDLLKVIEAMEQFVRGFTVNQKRKVIL